jgi:hypothetical protein
MDLREQKQIQTKDLQRHPWETARFQALRFFLKRIPGKVHAILDVGSGDGFVATELSRCYPDSMIMAVDIHYTDDFLQKAPSSRLVFAKSLDGLPAEKTEAVLLMDVLEHIEQPERLLQQLKHFKNITPATQFIITVPAFQSLFGPHDVFLGHYRRYSRKQIVALARAQGFAVKDSGYFFTSLLLARCFQKLLKKKQRQGLHNWRGGRFQTSLLSALLWMDFKISWYLSRLGIHLPGLSCYCLCHPLPS